MSEITLNDVVERIEYLLVDVGQSIETVEKIISDYAENDARKNIATLINTQRKLSYDILGMLQVICREIKKNE